MSNVVFQKRIRELRMKKNWTMDQLASQLGISKSRVSMWENNGTVPRKEVLFGLAKLYNVSIDYLLGNDQLEGIKPENKKLSYLQRNLGKLNEEELQQAEGMLKAVFRDIFEDEDEDDGI
ncbi:helix-turn-helix domain-containing protein [Floccifex sp.]|uniref:helix-turn-helix domain-containing protein n=1 Tax=Floccifex sp. TaxID=2815810 RepID=UPI003EFEF902